MRTTAAPEADYPLVEWSCRALLYQAQEQLHGLLRNFPNRWVAGFLRFLVFPPRQNLFRTLGRIGPAGRRPYH